MGSNMACLREETMLGESHPDQLFLTATRARSHALCVMRQLQAYMSSWRQLGLVLRRTLLGRMTGCASRNHGDAAREVRSQVGEILADALLAQLAQLAITHDQRCNAAHVGIDPRVHARRAR